MKPYSCTFSAARRSSIGQGLRRCAPILAVWMAGAFLLAIGVQGQDTSASRTTEWEMSLGFEVSDGGSVPKGWSGNPSGTISTDEAVVHSGRKSVRIDRGPDSPQAFTALVKSIPIGFSGQTVELSGFLRTDSVAGFAGLWMREDGETPNLAFDNMARRRLHGTTDWTQYSITLPIKDGATTLVFGALLTGTGKVWVDDLQVRVDGKALKEPPVRAAARTVLDSDHEFDAGSGVAVQKLTEVQVGNLALLGRIWGFLKYNHPRVAAGQVHWDYELFRVLPRILGAPNAAEAREEIARWIDGLGDIKQGAQVAELREAGLHLRPELGWIDDKTAVGESLGGRLRSIHRNRFQGEQFYVAKMPGVGNPDFRHELAYPDINLPDAGFQLLALYRFWNMVEYWFPYRDVMDEDWDAVLREFVPRIAEAKDAESYQRELMALIGRVHDSHANLWSSLRVRPPTGDAVFPVSVRFVDGEPVVVSYAQGGPGRDCGLEIGDVFLQMDGRAVGGWLKEWKPYYAAGNEAARLRDMAGQFTRGAAGPSAVRVRRENGPVDLTVDRISASRLETNGRTTHDLPGDTFRLLSEQVAYLKLSSVKAAEASRYVESARGTRGWVIDIRNYPSEFVVFALGSLLAPEKSDFVRFTECDLANPGAFHWGKTLAVTPAKPRYEGKIVVLVDEVTQSMAEYTAMAFRAAGATIVGSTTAGADGNVSRIPLPGGLSSMFSGIGVFYPDQKPTQRIGIVPDVWVRPTIAGIRTGRDEVLEAAIRQILDPQSADALIETLPRR